MIAPNFAFYYAGDAYSTETKIMGRQSAGKALMHGVARRWPEAEIHGFGSSRQAGQAMGRQLHGDGFRGTLRWRAFPGDAALDQLGAVYYPAPVTAELAHGRNSRGPACYSLFGVTHTLSSAGAMDQIASMILPPFKPWDALICTSTAALTVVDRIQNEMKDALARHLGASRFNDIKRPVIPLGVDAPGYRREPHQIARARLALGLAEDEVAFLFAGRLSFHAKANPAVFYQALQAAAARTERRLVCIEAGVFPNQGTADAFRMAQTQLAPAARFITVDGAVEDRYREAWHAADVFVSLSDNIQETFGLTPLEAMAAGLPLLVSDWNGYKDTVRDGVDGFRIPVVLAPPGSGADLAWRHAFGVDTYDYFIGRVSMATAVDERVLTDRIVALANDPALRRTLGEAGTARAFSLYDWPIILDRYTDLAAELGEVRAAAGALEPEPWPARPDPFSLFSDYPTARYSGAWMVSNVGSGEALSVLLNLGVTNYALGDPVLPQDLVCALHSHAGRKDHTVRSLLDSVSGQEPVKARALMWLCKFGLLRLSPPATA
jgi:glycosyltransferase involved in cell wall biosynthesis